MGMVETVQTATRIDSAFGASVVRKVAWRLIPFMGLLYFINYLDRVNVGFAALTMNHDLGFSPAVYGNGAGILFLGYFLFQVPSNMALGKYGTRAVIMPIMLLWGAVSMAMAFVTGPTSFYVLRFLLGAAEAGFFPGMILYLTYWFPASARGRVAGAFLLAIPLSSVLGAPASTALLGVSGLGLHGWQWLFILQGLPAVVLGLFTIRVLTDRPEQAVWLTDAEKSWLAGALADERRAAGPGQHSSFGAAILDIRVWTFALIYFGAVIGLYGITMWLPQILKGYGGLTNFQTGLLAMVPYTLAALAMYLWGAHSDATGERTWHVAIPAFLGGIGLAASALLSGNPTLDFIALTVAAIGVYVVIPVFWTLPTAVLTGTAAAGGIALINAVGNIGGYAGPALVGYVRETTQSYADALLTLAAFAFLAGILAVVIGRNVSRIADPAT
jgi:MFS transporter, ACS family, tartrate transporter